MMHQNFPSPSLKNYSNSETKQINSAKFIPPPAMHSGVGNIGYVRQMPTFLPNHSSSFNNGGYPSNAGVPVGPIFTSPYSNPRIDARTVF